MVFFQAKVKKEMWHSRSYTPIFNIFNFLERLEDNGGIDKSFHNRILETVLLPKSNVVLSKVEGDIASVLVPRYCENTTFYTSLSLLEKGEGEALLPLPSISEILQKLKDFPKVPYLLGGTSPFPTIFFLSSSFSPFENRHKKLFGIDCSGLLYFVTGGNVPRNTSALPSFGKRVKILAPLDLIYYFGHVLVYLGDGKVIEAREFDGVTISNWSEREKMITKDYFFIRWHPQAF